MDKAKIQHEVREMSKKINNEHMSSNELLNSMTFAGTILLSSVSRQIGLKEVLCTMIAFMASEWDLVDPDDKVVAKKLSEFLGGLKC